MKNNRQMHCWAGRGFTLIELMIGIAVIGILGMVLLPVTAVIKSTIADEATLIMLNQATKIYRHGERIETEDIFEGINTDDERLQVLANKGYIDNIPKPRRSDSSFQWHFDIETWELGNSHVTLTAQTVTMHTAGGFKGYIDGTYTGTAKKIIIPKTIDGEIVKAIYQNVFRGKNLTSVIFDLDSNISQIHARAFDDNDLTEIVLPENLQKIDYGAFNNNNIVKITIGQGVELEGNVFRNSNDFRDTYESQGAGTYVFVNGAWEKQ